MKEYQVILKQIAKHYQDKGNHFVESVGTQLYGKTPHLGKGTWHHEIFRPLLAGEVKTLQATIGIPFPDTLTSLYRVANGVRLFSDELALYGLRAPKGRKGGGVWQPYSLVEPNTLERPADAKPDELFIGGYSFDGSLVKLNTRSGIVAACKPGSARAAFARWPDLATFLRQEFQRLKKHFNDELELLDPDASTLPGAKRRSR